MKQLIDDNPKVLKLLNTAAEQRGSRYPIDLTQGYSTLIPHVSEFGKPLYLLCLKALAEAERNKPSQAVETLATAMSVVNSLAKEPITVSQIWYRSHQSTVISVAERIVNRTVPDTATLKRLETILSTAYDPNALIRGLIGEQCITLQAVRDPKSTGLPLDLISSSHGPSLVQMRLAQTFGRTDRFLIECIDLTERYIQVMRLPPEERVKAVQAIEPEMKQLREDYDVLHFFMPASWNHVFEDLESWTQLRVACTALAVERYRLANGALPDNLDALVPVYLEAVPQDPFDGQPLRYRRLEPGFMVYSVGKDLSDNQGKEKPRPRKKHNPPSDYDVTFIIER